jgi:cell division protein YceG involved in septum cleavage
MRPSISSDLSNSGSTVRKRLIEGQNSTVQKQLFEGQKSHDMTAPVSKSAALKVTTFKSGTEDAAQTAVDKVKGMFGHDPTAAQRKRRWTK